ncbi:MAG TPA: hypothetical protein VG820_04265 [Fimbriimonadaceae bacterium]|nr:hypothetical protein [Fimbriimonadaceae bacterium]
MRGDTNREFVTVYDQQGRELQIKRSDWNATIRARLQEIWNDPDQLYAKCLNAAHSGAFEPIEEATLQLLKLRPSDPEAIGLRASTLVGLDRFDEVEPFIQGIMAAHGPSCFTCFHLGMAHKARGDLEKCIEMLREGLELDPNFVPGMQHYVAMQQERLGAAKVDALLMDLLTRKQSWLAGCFLAARRLQSGEKGGAVEMYRMALNEEGWYPEMLRQIVGQLSEAGMHQEAFDLVSPHYQQAMSPEIGLVLVSSLIALDRLDEADGLLHQIALQARPPYHGQIAQLSSKITALRKPIGTQMATDTVVPHPYTINRPTWWRALKNPEWLAPERQRKSRVDFTAFAVQIAGTREGRDAIDRLGRLSRSVPLLMMERLLFDSDCDAMAVILAVPNQGACVVPGIGDQAYRQMVRADADYLVRGTIIPSRRMWRAEIEIVRVAGWKIVERCKADFVIGEEGPALHALMHRTLTRLGKLGPIHPYPQSNYLPPLESVTATYLTCLEQQAAYFLCDAGFGGPDRIYGRRNILNNLHSLTVNTGCPQAPAIFLSALLSDKAQGEDFYREFEPFVLQFVNAAQPGSLVDLLSPFAFQLYDKPAEFAAAVARLKQTSDQAYVTWLLTAFPNDLPKGHRNQ